MQKIDVSTKTYPNTFAIVDDDLYPYLSIHKWSVARKDSRFYARRSVDGKTIWMHRIIMAARPGQEIDHKDLNGLNNLRSNLRLASRSQNIANQVRHSSTSKYKGVRKHTACDKWQARIKHNYKEIYLGLYNTEIEAAHAYDRAARTCFKEFARTNF